MKLRQGQIWKLDEQYIRIVVLERLAVEYKTTKSLLTREGTHHHATKKEFCSLIKKATLVPPAPNLSL
ncbi:MAG: hypothetical protein JWQ71_1418 [Pedosphaera sp.]|jgi:hypothetical protein|nr:hypothetical protein [Pedosphaera sp.]